MARGIVLSAPTSSSVQPAALRRSSLSQGATSKPMPAPSMPRVAAISAASGSVNSALLMAVAPLSRIEQSAANAKPDFTMGTWQAADNCPSVRFGVRWDGYSKGRNWPRGDERALVAPRVVWLKSWLDYAPVKENDWTLGRAAADAGSAVAVDGRTERLLAQPYFDEDTQSYGWQVVRSGCKGAWRQGRRSPALLLPAVGPSGESLSRKATQGVIRRSAGGAPTCRCGGSAAAPRCRCLCGCRRGRR